MPPKSRTPQRKTGDNHLLQPKLAILKTLDQLKKQFPDLEIGDGSRVFKEGITNGKEDANKRSTPQRTAARKTTPKLKPPMSVQKRREALKVKEEECKSAIKVKLSPMKNGRTSQRVAKERASESLRQIAQQKPDEFKVKPKPGTAGSRTAIGPKSKTVKTNKDREKLALFATLHSLNTNYIVDDTILAFTPEIAQRIDLDYIPRDPKKLCKSFTLELTELGLPTEACHTQEEIQEWGSRYEGLYC